MNTRIIIFFLVYSVTVFQAPAQSYVFQLLDASQGLPTSECISLEQDYLGYLWVGTTAGLSRYNGYTFENFSHANDGERFGKVNAIKEDGENRLWIGSDNGLFVKTQEDSIYKLAGSNSTAQGVNDILLLGQEILLATEIGPLLVSKEQILANVGSKTHALSTFQIREWQSQSFDAQRIEHLSLSSDGSVYMSGPYDVYRYHNQSFERVYKNDGTGSVIMSVSGVNADRFYFYSGTRGLFRGTRNEVVHLTLKDHYQPDATPKGKSDWLLFPPGAIELFTDSEIIKTELDLVPQGILWTSDFLVDDQGVYWLAAHDGLMKIRRSPFEKIPFTVDTREGEIYSVCETRDGKFLLGSNRGLVVEKKGKEFLPVYHVVDMAEVFAIHEEPSGDLWFATGYNGLVLRTKNRTEVFTEENGLRNNSNHSFFTATDGRLFVVGDKGATQIVRSPDGKVSFENFYLNPSSSQYATLFSVVESPDRTLWFAGQEGIFKLMDDSLVVYTLDTKGISIVDMKMDNQGKVWLAVNGEGVWQAEFDQTGGLKVVERFDQRRGLITQAFSKLFLDKEGNVWVSHYQGISIIRRDKVILNYDQHDGWPFKNYNNLFLYEDQKGKFWAGCSKGIVQFNRDGMLANSEKPRIFLSAAIPSPNHPDETRTIPKDRKLELPYNERELTFNYYAIDFPNQDGLRYAYKLGNSEWTDLGSTRSLALNHLSPGEYDFSVRALNSKGAASDEVSMHIDVRSPFWRTPVFIVTVLVLLVITSSMLVRRREKMIHAKEQQKKAHEIEMISLHRDLANSRLIALRSQMNPHFIFNALNSIQQFVLQGNVDEASRYLTLFSLLHREILNTSDESFITLQREVDMLRMYIQLEQLRFDERFTYAITLEEEIDAEEIRIPPMLIQPFVENAIWHGLMPKEGSKRVEIDFKLGPTDDSLICTVHDNGIGREASARMKIANGNLANHQPKGIKLIVDRIQMLRQRYQLPFEMQVSDKVDGEGTVSGTVVTIALALERNSFTQQNSEQ